MIQKKYDEDANRTQRDEWIKHQSEPILPNTHNTQKCMNINMSTHHEDQSQPTHK